MLLRTGKSPENKGKTARKPGTLSFVVRCNPAAHVALRGKLIEALKPKHHKERNKTYRLAKALGSAKPNVAITLTITAPKAALTALKAGAHESIALTMTATNANGTSTSSATIRTLKVIRT